MAVSAALQRRLLSLLVLSFQLLLLLWASHAAQRKFHYASHAYGGYDDGRVDQPDSDDGGVVESAKIRSPRCATSVSEAVRSGDRALRSVCGSTVWDTGVSVASEDDRRSGGDDRSTRSAASGEVGGSRANSKHSGAVAGGLFGAVSPPNDGGNDAVGETLGQQYPVPQFTRVLWLLADSLPLDWVRGQAPDEVLAALGPDKDSTDADITEASVDEDLWSDLLAPLRASSNWFRILNEGFKFSSALYTSFFTGMLPANYHARHIVHDSIFSQMVQSGHEVHYVGPHFVTLDLFPTKRDDSEVFEFAEDRGEGRRRTVDVYGESSQRVLFSHLGLSPADPLGYVVNTTLARGASLFAATNQLDHAMHKSGRSDPANYRLARSVSSVFRAAREYVDEHRDTLLVLMSDHGASAHGGSNEGSLHGDAGGGNCAWAVLYSPELEAAASKRGGGNPASKSHARGQGTTVRLHDGAWIDTVDFAATLSQYVAGVNIPSSSIGRAMPIFDGDKPLAFLTAFQNAKQLSVLAERESIPYARGVLVEAEKSLLSGHVSQLRRLQSRLDSVIVSIKETFYESKRFPFFWLVVLLCIVAWRITGMLYGVVPPPFTLSALLDTLRSWSRALDVIAVVVSPGLLMFWDFNFLAANYYLSQFQSSHKLFLVVSGAVVLWFSLFLGRERIRSKAENDGKLVLTWHVLGKWTMLAKLIWVFLLLGQFASRRSRWSALFGSWPVDVALLLLWLGADAYVEFSSTGQGSTSSKQRRAGKWSKLRANVGSLVHGPGTYWVYLSLTFLFPILDISQRRVVLSVALGLVVLHGVIACVFAPRALLLPVVFLAVVGTRLAEVNGVSGIPSNSSANVLIVLLCALPYSVIIQPAFSRSVRGYWSRPVSLREPTTNATTSAVARPVVRWLSLWQARSLGVFALAAAAMVFHLRGGDYENFAVVSGWTLPSIWHGVAFLVARDAPFYMFVALLGRLRDLELDIDSDVDLEGPSGRQSPTRMITGVLFVRALVLLCAFHLSFWLYKEYHTCYGVAMMACTFAGLSTLVAVLSEWVRVAAIVFDEPESPLLR